MDEDGKDQGANVRQKAKDITNLLQDESRLREERRTRASMRDRMIRGSGMPDDDIEDENAVRRKPQQGTNGLAGKRPNRDEDELRRAIEESKKSLAQDMLTAEERDLQQALRLSKEEEEKRMHDVDSSNAAALFDDSNQLSVDFLVFFGRDFILTRLLQVTAKCHPQQQSFPIHRPKPLRCWPATPIHCAATIHIFQPLPTTSSSRTGGCSSRIPPPTADVPVSAAASTATATAARRVDAPTAASPNAATATAATKSLRAAAVLASSTYRVWVRPFFA